MKYNEKIVFLILHYKVIEETKKCVESIINNYSNENYEIVIVDNGSLNESGEKLKNMYKNNSNIFIIINKKNLGFAKGNNVGFKFAKKRGANYIIMVNNDIVFTQNNFCKLMIEKYNEFHYAILGPKILLPKGDEFCYNIKVKSVKEQYIFIFLLYVRLFLAYIGLGKIFEILFKKKNKKRKNRIDINIKRENIPIYGCCIIFSEDYINRFDGIDDRTFLYCEESLLYLRTLENDLKIVYDPQLEILHNHSVVTKQINNTIRKKEIFVVKNLIKSNKILLKELKKYKRMCKQNKCLY